MANLFRMSADLEDGELVFQRTILPELEFSLFLYWKGRRCDWSLQTSWFFNPLFLQLSAWICSHNLPTRQLLLSVLQLFISIWMEKCYILLKPARQSIEKELVCLFQAARSILLQMFRASKTRHRQQSAEGTAAGTGPVCSQACSSLS